MGSVLEKPREDVLLSSSLSKVRSTERKALRHFGVTFVMKCQHQCCLCEHEHAYMN